MSIVTITGNVKYSITLDPSVWILMTENLISISSFQISER